MKKTLIIVLMAVITLASCTKRENSASSSRTIGFQTAAYATRAGIEGTEFPTTETFGVYAWAEGSLGEYFMPNALVSYGADDLWTAAGTYYWPQDVTIDFFGYYPYGMQGLTVGQKEISYSDIDVEASQEDVMYSSKSVGYGYNPDGTHRGIDGSAGVPILFHHALGKVEVEARAAYDHYEATDGSVYDWEVTVNSITVEDFFHKGSATFTLAEEPTEGLVDWVKPTDEAQNRVWTNDGDKTLISNEPKVLLPTGKDDEGEYIYVNLLPEFFVLPQAVTEPERDEDGWPLPGQKIHRVTLDATIITKLDGEQILRESHAIRTAYLWLEDIPAWQINFRTIYRLVVYPLGPGHGPGPDYDNPVITFDPAVADWEYKTVFTTIIL